MSIFRFHFHKNHKPKLVLGKTSTDFYTDPASQTIPEVVHPELQFSNANTTNPSRQSIISISHKFKPPERAPNRPPKLQISSSNTTKLVQESKLLVSIKNPESQTSPGLQNDNHNSKIQIPNPNFLPQQPKNTTKKPTKKGGAGAKPSSKVMRIKRQKSYPFSEPPGSQKSKNKSTPKGPHKSAPISTTNLQQALPNKKSRDAKRLNKTKKQSEEITPRLVGHWRVNRKRM